MTRHDNTTTAAAVHFDSVEQWCKYAAANVLDNDDHFFEHQTFCGRYTGVEMVRRIRDRECSEATRREVHAKSVHLPPLSTETDERDGMTFYNDECGLFYDSVADLNGEQDCMITFDMQVIERPVIWIACNIGALYNFKESQFKNRGIALIRAIHALERAGVSIGLIGYSKASGGYMSGHDTALQTMVIKQPDNALDESTLINVFAGKNAFRTIGFTVRATLTNDRWEMGSTMTVTPADFEASYATGHDLVILPYQDINVYNNADTATDWTLEQVKAQAQISF